MFFPITVVALPCLAQAFPKKHTPPASPPPGTSGGTTGGQSPPLGDIDPYGGSGGSGGYSGDSYGDPFFKYVPVVDKSKPHCLWSGTDAFGDDMTPFLIPADGVPYGAPYSFLAICTPVCHL